MDNTTETDLILWSKFLMDTFENEAQWVQIFSIVIYLIIFFVSLIGNGLTCFVIYYVKSMHTATNFYLFNLAVSDLIVTFNILLDIYDYLTIFSNYNEITCKFRFFLVISLFNNGILVMTLLAIERYIVICFPLMLSRSPVLKRTVKVIIIAWIVAMLESLLDLWTVGLIKTHKLTICFIIPRPASRVLNGILALLTFVVPLIIMTFVYAMIAFKVNDNEKSKSEKGGQVFNHRDNRGRVNKIITLTSSFLVCWLPFFVLRIMIFTYDVQELVEFRWWWSIGLRVTFINTWMSVVLNPILFSLLSTKFRKELKILWSTKIKQGTIIRNTVHI
ncbi:neuromedin-U receptor 1-like isoform X2 [Leptidea sinapis]|uniref:neuromedin-U receptor 1-like isoform X2 n=1 Tax=Leptidea sinapis TaxID=189913 RepID=UPI0021C3440F|nr:neuromedin-U receptor 1-like isoform X2 [Leptidea sinapis]